MTKKRIRYLLRAFPKPFGGPMQTRRHVQMLAAHGFDAALVIDSLSDAHFYGLDVPTILYRDFHIDEHDICVIPEGWRDHYRQLMKMKARRICFCQNHYYVNRTFAEGESFKSFGVETALCCSQQVANHLERYYDLSDLHVIPCGIENPAALASEKRLAISYMPRKAPTDAHVIRDLFRRMFPDLADVEWVSIDGMAHGDAMERLGQTAIFLSLSHREGLGLPPLEAMSMGTVVVGFHGGGGLEYATHRNGLWCAEGDLEGCAEALGLTAGRLRARRRETSDLIVEGRSTARRFDMAVMREKLVTYWMAQV